MSISTEETMRLVNLLTGDETPEEHLETLAMLATNPALQEEYEQLKRIQIGFKATDVSLKLKEIHRKAQRTRVIRMTTYRVVASITLIIGVWSIFDYITSNPAEELYLAYYQHPDIVANSTDALLLNEGISLLEHKQTLDAIIVFRKVNTPSSKWYLALALLRNKQEQEAQLVLKQIANNPNSPFQQQAIRLLKELSL